MFYCTYAIFIIILECIPSIYLKKMLPTEQCQTSTSGGISEFIAILSKSFQITVPWEFPETSRGGKLDDPNSVQTKANMCVCGLCLTKN